MLKMVHSQAMHRIDRTEVQIASLRERLAVVEGELFRGIRRPPKEPGE